MALVTTVVALPLKSTLIKLSQKLPIIICLYVQTYRLCCNALLVCPFTSQVKFCIASLADVLALHAVRLLLHYTSHTSNR